MKLGLLLLCLLPALPSPAQPKPHSVDLSWTASASKGVTDYNIYRKDQSGGPWLNIGTTSETKFTDRNVKPHEKYRYKVCALVQGIEGRCTEEVKVDVPRK